MQTRTCWNCGERQEGYSYEKGGVLQCGHCHQVLVDQEHVPKAFQREDLRRSATKDRENYIDKDVVIVEGARRAAVWRSGDRMFAMNLFFSSTEPRVFSSLDELLGTLQSEVKSHERVSQPTLRERLSCDIVRGQLEAAEEFQERYGG